MQKKETRLVRAAITEHEHHAMRLRALRAKTPVAEYAAYLIRLGMVAETRAKALDGKGRGK